MTEKSNGNADSASRRWLSYRSEIKVFDCTIRDGGLMNDHQFIKLRNNLLRQMSIGTTSVWRKRTVTMR